MRERFFKIAASLWTSLPLFIIYSNTTWAGSPETPIIAAVRKVTMELACEAGFSGSALSEGIGTGILRTIFWLNPLFLFRDPYLGLSESHYDYDCITDYSKQIMEFIPEEARTRDETTR